MRSDHAQVGIVNPEWANTMRTEFWPSETEFDSFRKKLLSIGKSSEIWDTSGSGIAFTIKPANLWRGRDHDLFRQGRQARHAGDL